ncbi:single-strand DNA-binding protein [Microbacterium resistens]|uniref:Single-stranded DNA-binding protein n=1 Tax=Microbacterium resistens TaxID=156977 RepID=A0ABU1SH60_9MICO|nr:single-stranded DNA-binding protein [Microbacterium resistens]MDR6868951.1 single-strand DNA-binding protein [Microbacterium resistens]
MSAQTTVIGNTTADVELRYTSNGKPVANVTVAVSDRKFDKQRNEWVDGDVWFARCTMWNELAEHAAASIHKGTRVIGFGRIVQRDWEDRDGQKRSSVEVILDEIGPSLRYATAQVTRAARAEGGQADRGRTETATDTGWATTPLAGAQTDAWGGGDFGDDTPF